MNVQLCCFFPWKSTETLVWKQKYEQVKYGYFSLVWVVISDASHLCDHFKSAEFQFISIWPEAFLQIYTQVHSLLKINSCQLYFLWVSSLVGLTWGDSKQRRPQNRNSTNCQNFHLRILSLKESYPPNLHCARLLLLLSGVSLQAIPYLGVNINCGRDRKILSSIVEVIWSQR